MLFFFKFNGEQQPTINELLITLQHMFQEIGDVFIVFDAFDECKDRQDLLAGIEEMLGWSDKLYMFVACRKDRDIEDYFETVVDVQNIVCI